MSDLRTFLISDTGLRTAIRRLFLLLILCVCGVDEAFAQTYPASWPADSSWMNYTQLGAVLQDLATAAGDSTDGGTGVNPDSADVYKGTSGTLPSVYFYYDASNQVLFFRMRLRGNPQQGGQSQLQNGTWNAILDTDGDGYKEFFVELNGNGTDTLNIYFGDTSRQDIVSADCSDGEGRVFTLSAVLSTHYRITADTGGGFFLDFQAPLSSFDNCGGTQVVTTSTPFSLVFTTSATTQNPTQKDLTGPGDYTMAATSMLPFGDGLTLSGGITQNPLLSGMTHACGGGTNFDPITLTATVVDTLIISGSGTSASIVDSISSVTFFYRISGSSVYTQIAQINAPVSGTVNTWQTTWSTASIPSTTYAVRVLVVDEQGNQMVDSSYAIDLGTCTKVAAPTSADILSFAAMDDGKGRVLLRWETGNELDNLGFNLYRDEKNRRTLINPDLIAGSAFLTAPGILLSAGMSYRWLDASPGPSKDIQYWLEDIDLNGNSSWHGPFAVQPLDRAEESNSSPGAAPLLGSLAGDSLPGHILPGRPVEQRAKAREPSANTLALQSAIASQHAIKVAVNRQGWYRISQPQLLAAGLSPAVDPRNLQMMAGGRPLPIIVRGQEDGRLDPQDYVEFYGIGPDSPYSADRIYWLFSASAPGSRIQVTASDNKPATAASFPYTVERRDKTFFFSSLVNGEAENFFGAVVSGSPVLQVLKLRNMAASKSPASIEVALQGVTLAPHQVEVSLNGDVIGVARFFDRERGLLKADIPQSLLREGDNIVALQRQTGNNSVSLVEHIRITYQHSYRADDDFLQLEAKGGQQIRVSGFGSASIRMFDVTDPDDVREISCLVSKGDGFAASASVPGQGKRVLIALAGSQFPVAVTPNAPSLWRQAGLGADLVILSRRDLFDSLKPLVAYRQSRGLSVATVDLEDIYDEFNFGHKSPQAIKDFLAYT
ncbi:MAG TPA: C25 family cysteine peptidase, partial [Blastocatellia bacterium]|nr:C25 family cysteine peptidase [Blastocatellia bacterium]